MKLSTWAGHRKWAKAMDFAIFVLISVCLCWWMLNTDQTLNSPLSHFVHMICEVKLHFFTWKPYLLYEAQICVCWSEFATAGIMWLLIDTDYKETATGMYASPLLPSGWCPNFSFCKFKSTFKKVRVYFTVKILIALIHIQVTLWASI